MSYNVRETKPDSSGVDPSRFIYSRTSESEALEVMVTMAVSNRSVATAAGFSVPTSKDLLSARQQ